MSDDLLAAFERDAWINRRKPLPHALKRVQELDDERLIKAFIRRVKDDAHRGRPLWTYESAELYEVLRRMSLRSQLDDAKRKLATLQRAVEAVLQAPVPYKLHAPELRKEIIALNEALDASIYGD
jgi:DNA-binding Lrp family transcriptional regulator